MQEQAAAEGAAGAARDKKAHGKQVQPQQARPKQRKLFLESVSEDEAEPVTATGTAKQQPAAAAAAAAAKQQASSKAQGQQLKRGTQAQEMEESDAEADDDNVPATYDNIPLKQKQSSRQVSEVNPSGDAEEDVQDTTKQKDSKEHGQQVQKQKRLQKLKQQQQQQQLQAAQVLGNDLEFAASDAESDEYEPTQAKAAARAAARKGTVKTAQPKGPKGRSRQPKQDKQQGGSKQPCKAAKATDGEGPAKRPRGRPRKAQQEQQPRQQQNKRKVADMTDAEESDEEPRQAAAKHQAKGSGQFKTAPLVLQEVDDEHEAFQVTTLNVTLWYWCHVACPVAAHLFTLCWRFQHVVCWLVVLMTGFTGLVLVRMEPLRWHTPENLRHECCVAQSAAAAVSVVRGSYDLMAGKYQVMVKSFGLLSRTSLQQRARLCKGYQNRPVTTSCSCPLQHSANLA